MGSRLTEQLGRCVRELRTARGLSQVEFGEKCGFYQTYLSRVENGRANPTINAIEVIANALGLTVFELFDLVRTRMLQKQDVGASSGSTKSRSKRS